MKLHDALKFRSLARKRTRSEKDYIAFQEFQAEKVVHGINRNYNLKNKKVLDLGCGRGGYTKVFRKAGADVVSLDLELPPFGEIFSSFVQGDATRLPFGDESFDFVYSSSLIEHLPNPILLLIEVKRVLKLDGIFYLSFPPFYTPVGGHQFKPFNMFLPEKLATFMARKLYNVRSYKYDDKFGKLHIMTIRKARLMIKKTGLRIVKIKTRFMKINPARVPLLNEFLTWHVEFYLKK